MDIHLATALGSVRLAVGDTAQKASNRRLNVYRDEVKCKPACHGCCSRPISISIAEATIIYEYLVANGRWPKVRDRARAQFMIAQSTEPIAWFKMNVKCPVLNHETGMCSSYEVRPPACSTHFVKSDPDGCDPWNMSAIDYESVPMDDLYSEFQEKLKFSVGEHGIMSMVTRIPVALLIAERIRVKTNLSLDEAIALLYREFK